MPLITHRGAAGLAPANTFESIHVGSTYAPEYIEIDINCTADGVLVLCHGSMARFMRGKPMSESFEEYTATKESVITFQDFLDSAEKLPYMFDIKVSDDSSLSLIGNLLSKWDTPFALTSPHLKALRVLKQACPDAPVFQSQPYHHGPITALEIARKYKFEGVALNKWWMTPLVHRLCKAHNKKLMCYTVDSRLGIRTIGKLFPDVYIVTNRPDVYREIFPVS